MEKNIMRSYILAILLIIAHTQFAISEMPSNYTEVGIFNVYFSLDEALGYLDVRDDFAEVYAVGCNIVTHYFRGEHSLESNGQRFWAGLPGWLNRNPRQAERLKDWKKKYGSSLGWELFFWSTYIQEAYNQTDGGLKALIGEMYGIFGEHKDWAALKTFVQAISKFEKEHCPGSIAGWYIAEEPNGSRKRYSPEIANQVIENIKSAESEAGIKHREIYIDVSANHKKEKVAPFLKNVDVIMLSPDAYIWATSPPTYIEEARYERIHHAVRRIREYAAAVNNQKARVIVVLQAYDWNQSGPLQPNHINMHQQVRYALQSGLVDRGIYGYNPRWVKPSDGLWFWWWHDCKSKKIPLSPPFPKGERKGNGMITINRWDSNTEGSWAEAIKTELQNKENAVVIHGNENWSGKVHIIGDVIIAEDSVLTIEPGTTVKFSVRDHFRGGQDTKRCELIVRGKLIGKGNKKRWITLTSDSMNRKQLASPKKSRSGDWYGIRKEGEKAKVELEYCHVKYALVTE
jgi:hypothetical protein